MAYGLKACSCDPLIKKKLLALKWASLTCIERNWFMKTCRGSIPGVWELII